MTDPVQAGWDALRERCCATGTDAKRCVMVSRADFAAAAEATLRAAAPPPDTRSDVERLRHHQAEAARYAQRIAGDPSVGVIVDSSGKAVTR